MPKIINLKTVKKQRKREDDREKSKVRAAKFGRTSTEAETQRLQRKKQSDFLDHHKRET